MRSFNRCNRFLPLLFSFFTLAWSFSPQTRNPRHEKISFESSHGQQQFFQSYRGLQLKCSENSSSEFLDRLRLSDRFDRWKFLQNLLDGDVATEDVNHLVYAVLDGYIKYPKPELEDSKDDGSPPPTPEIIGIVRDLLESAEGGAIAVSDPKGGPGDVAVLEKMKRILPDRKENEDAFKSNWDTLIEIHGRDIVKFSEENPTPQWDVDCVVARVLIYYDFVTYGIIDSTIY